MRGCASAPLFFANKKFANANFISVISNQMLDFYQEIWYPKKKNFFRSTLWLQVIKNSGNY
jgi:hypothetical protein